MSLGDYARRPPLEGKKDDFYPILPIIHFMTNGRPKGTKLDPEHPGPVVVEVCEIDERARVRLPPRITSGVQWFEKGTFDCLMVLDEPGRVILLPWKPYGEDVIKSRRDIVHDFASDLSLKDVVSALAYRYHRLPIPADSRPYIGALALLHLNLPEGVASRAHLIRLPDHLELVSPSLFREICRKLLAQFPELP